MADLKRGGNAILYTVLAIGAVVFVNIISSNVFGRIDMTEDKVYSLSQASKNLVGKLPDRLTVKAFISGDMPEHPQLKALERYLRDMLDEYAAHSNGKLVWEALDPSGDKKVAEEARRLKVSPRSLAVYGQTKSSVAQAYLGVAFQYGGKVEAIPFVARMGDLEYQISSAIRRLTTKKRKVGFTTGHGEPSLFRGLRIAKAQLKDYDVVSVNLKDGKKDIPKDVDILVVAGPTKRFAPRAKFELDAYLMRGKALLFLVDGMVLQTPRGQFGGRAPPRIARANNTDLDDMLEYWGVKLGEDIIFDRQSQRVQLPVGNGQAVVTDYPGFPVVTDLDKENPITRKLKAYVSIFPSSVQLTGDAKSNKGGLKGVVLAKSSQASWRHTGFFLFDALRQPKPSKDVGPHPLGVTVSGTFKSFYDGKPKPPVGPAKPKKEKVQAPAGKKKSPPSARLVVFGDSDIVKDQFLGLSQGANLSLLLNAVDYLAQDETLIGIRTKSQTRRPMKEIEDSDALWAKVFNIAGLPLLFIGIGVVRWRLRRARRVRDAEEVSR
ncbi:MAG: GldG family protein [Myxococcales bacterium]|nr:GldG family protein [Myxococcales bacterium]